MICCLICNTFFSLLGAPLLNSFPLCACAEIFRLFRSSWNFTTPLSPSEAFCQKKCGPERNAENKAINPARLCCALSDNTEVQQRTSIYGKGRTSTEIASLKLSQKRKIRSVKKFVVKIFGSQYFGTSSVHDAAWKMMWDMTCYLVHDMTCDFWHDVTNDMGFDMTCDITAMQ